VTIPKVIQELRIKYLLGFIAAFCFKQQQQQQQQYLFAISDWKPEGPQPIQKEIEKLIQ